MKKLKVVLILFLLVLVTLSGCIEYNKVPSESSLKNIQLIDAFCKSEGFDYGITQDIRYEERKIITNYNHKNYEPYFGAAPLGDSVICVKDIKIYQTYTSTYSEFLEKVIYINKTE